MKTFSKEPGSEHLKDIACPICGVRETKVRWALDGFSFTRCPGCGLVYQNPQPRQDDLSERYDEEYFSYEIENENSFHRLARLGLSDIDFDYHMKELTGKNRSFLDIGCATGRLISGLRQDQWQVQGVEICRPAAEYGIEQFCVPIYIGTLETADFPGSSFGVVHCSHLIEHLTDPVAFLLEVRRILAPGGWFIVATPNIAGLQAKLMGSRWRSAIADHMFLFSRRTLRRLLQGAGFQVWKTRTWGGIGAGITKDCVKKPVDRLAKKFGFGDVMIMLAKVPPDDHPRLVDIFIPKS